MAFNMEIDALFKVDSLNFQFFSFFIYNDDTLFSYVGFKNSKDILTPVRYR